MKDKILCVRLILYFIGVFFMPAGVVLTVNSRLGAGGYDALNFALSDTFQIKTSLVIYCTSIFCILITALIRKGYPKITTFVASFLLGISTDFWRSILDYFQPNNVFESVMFLALGMIIVSMSAASYMLSSFSTSPTDDLVISLKEKGLPLSLAKISFDIICVLLAFVSGGIVSWGTIIITIGIGPLVHLCFYFLSKYVYNPINNQALMKS